MPVQYSNIHDGKLIAAKSDGDSALLMLNYSRFAQQATKVLKGDASSAKKLTGGPKEAGVGFRAEEGVPPRAPKGLPVPGRRPPPRNRAVAHSPSPSAEENPGMATSAQVSAFIKGTVFSV